MATRRKTSNRKWMQKAVKRPGAFTRKAKAAGMSVAAYAEKVLSPGSRADTLTKRQALFARTARRIAQRRKRRG